MKAMDITVEKIYYNGEIITMEQSKPALGVLTRDGVIAALGSRDALKRMACNAEEIDLHGNTMLPAFIDSHSHPSALANSYLQADLSACANFDEIEMRIREFIIKNQIKPGAWVIASGYDQNALNEKKHPDTKFADSCAAQNPLVIQHVSGHAGVFNTKALKLLAAGQGGSPETGGYMEENEYFKNLNKVPMPDMETLLNAYARAQQEYAAHGIATVQEGMMVEQLIPLYKQLTAPDKLLLDVTAYVSPADADAVFSAFPNCVGRRCGRFKIGGYKIFLDGSPQNRTAWMRTPYSGTSDFTSGGTMSDEQVLTAILLACRSNLQILAHCNGDAAAEQFLCAAEQAQRTCDITRLRPVIIHAQLIGLDQLPRVKSLGMIPSFFAAHVYYWGDTHIKNFGAARAAEISPAAAAKALDLPFTLHQDAPVIKPDMLQTIWCAVNRVTKNGVALGPEQRLSVIDALKSVTLNAAHQYFDEDIKGSIKPGKKADFVILDQNPLTVSINSLKDIKVVQTIKDDRIIYACKK